MGSVSIVSLLAFGFVMGVKHAVDADHLAAVSTMASERRSLLSSSMIGAMWGLGHTVSLMAAGVVVIFLNFEISKHTEQVLEFCVGIMLVVLGINTLRKLARGMYVHNHVHEHGDHLHAHPHIHKHSEDEGPHTHHGLCLSTKPLLIGIVHGLAGSAAIMLLVLTTISSPVVGLLYIAIFGIGSIGGMMIMSTLIALPARFAPARYTRANLALRCVTGLFSLSFGIFMIYQIGFVGRLVR